MRPSKLRGWSRRGSSPGSSASRPRNGSDAMFFDPPVEGAARQAERLGGLADAAAVAGEGLLDQQLFDLLERQILDALRSGSGGGGVEAQVGSAQLLARRH